MACCYNGKALISKKCTSHRWLGPTPRIQPGPLCLGTLSAQAWGLLGPASTFLSLFVLFFAEPEKRCTRDPSQKHPRGPTTSKEKDTTEALPHTDVPPVPATEAKTHWPQPLLFFFFQSERDSSAFRTQRLSGLPEPCLQKATANTQKRKNKRRKIPPPCPQSEEQRGKGGRGARGRRPGAPLFCLPFIPAECSNT